jgi:hypothetical protein
VRRSDPDTSFRPDPETGPGAAAVSSVNARTQDGPNRPGRECAGRTRAYGAAAVRVRRGVRFLGFMPRRRNRRSRLTSPAHTQNRCLDWSRPSAPSASRLSNGGQGPGGGLPAVTVPHVLQAAAAQSGDRTGLHPRRRLRATVSTCSSPSSAHTMRAMIGTRTGRCRRAPRSCGRGSGGRTPVVRSSRQV